MNFTQSGAGSMALVVFTTLVSIVTTIFWMIIGWRAMRAHERLADRIEEKFKSS